MQQQQQSLLNPFLNILEEAGKWHTWVQNEYMWYFTQSSPGALDPPICAFSAAYQTSLQLWSLPLFHILS